MMYVWQLCLVSFTQSATADDHHSRQVEELQANMNLSSRRAASQLQSAQCDGSWVAWRFDIRRGWASEIWHQLIDVLSHLNPIIFAVFHRNPNNNQLLQEFATIHDVC